MKLKKTKKDIVEAIKTYQKAQKNEMFEIDARVKAVAPPSFVDAIAMSEKNKQLVKDRMKEREKDHKEFEKETVERKENKTPKTDDMKSMKMVEEFVRKTFKGTVSINENVLTVLTTSRTELTKLIEHAREQGIKYSIGRIKEGYQFNYKFEILNESKTLTESHSATFEELSEWCKGDVTEMFNTIKRIREDKMNDGDKKVFSDFGFDALSKEELDKKLDELESSVSSYLHDSGDFSEEQISKIDALREKWDSGDDEDYEHFQTYEKAHEFLEKKAKENSKGFKFFEIVEDSLEIPNGLLLIGYSDEKHEHETGEKILVAVDDLEDDEHEVDMPWGGKEKRKLPSDYSHDDVDESKELKEDKPLQSSHHKALIGKLTEAKKRTFNINEWKTLPVGTSVTIEQMEIIKIGNNLLWSAEWGGETETIDSYIKSQEGYEEFEDAYISKLSRQELQELIEEEGIELTEAKKRTTIDMTESKEDKKSVDIKKCRDIMQNQIDWTDVDKYGDVDFAIDQVRSLRSENVITDDEYDYIMSNWDKLQESKKLKEDTDKKADLQKEISWCKSVLNNPKGKAAMDAKANYGKGYVAQVKRDLMGFEKQLKQLDESKKTIKEGLQSSPYKTLIGNHFDHTFDFEFLDIVASTLNRIDFGADYNDEDLDLEAEVSYAVDDALIYTEDQWTVAKHYASSPAELDWSDALDEFSQDIFALVEDIMSSKKPQDKSQD